MADELRLIEEKLPPDSEATRRVSIRSLFASIEILLSETSQEVAQTLPPPSEGTSHDEKHRYFLELCALTNISFEISANGILFVQPPRIPLERRVLFVIKMLAKRSGVDIVPKQEEGWTDMRDALRIRNRITHPKCEADLSVSEEEYNTAKNALMWLVMCHRQALGVDSC